MELSSIDLFCGAGGLSLGLERAGFRPVAGLDLNKDACATYRRRFPTVEVMERSIIGVDFRQWRGPRLNELRLCVVATDHCLELPWTPSQSSCANHSPSPLALQGPGCP